MAVSARGAWHSAIPLTAPSPRARDFGVVACDPVGLTYIDGRVHAPGRTRKSRRVRFLVDSGAIYSVLRKADWRALGLKPSRTLDFVLADGTTLSRGVSECTFEIQGHRATSPVVLGETEDEALLGAVTLETLGLMLNPLSRTLQPMRLVLATRRG